MRNQTAEKGTERQDLSGTRGDTKDDVFLKTEEEEEKKEREGERAQVSRQRSECASQEEPRRRAVYTPEAKACFPSSCATALVLSLLFFHPRRITRKTAASFLFLFQHER